MRAIPKHYSDGNPGADYRVACDRCSAPWPRRELRRDGDGNLLCPRDYDRAMGELNRANARRSGHRARPPKVDAAVVGTSLLGVPGVLAGEALIAEYAPSGMVVEDGKVVRWTDGGPNGLHLDHAVGSDLCPDYIAVGESGGPEARFYAPSVSTSLAITGADVVRAGKRLSVFVAANAVSNGGTPQLDREYGMGFLALEAGPFPGGVLKAPNAMALFTAPSWKAAWAAAVGSSGPFPWDNLLMKSSAARLGPQLFEFHTYAGTPEWRVSGVNGAAYSPVVDWTVHWDVTTIMLGRYTVFPVTNPNRFAFDGTICHVMICEALDRDVATKIRHSLMGMYKIPDGSLEL